MISRSCGKSKRDGGKYCKHCGWDGSAGHRRCLETGCAMPIAYDSGGRLWTQAFGPLLGILVFVGVRVGMSIFIIGGGLAAGATLVATFQRSLAGWVCGGCRERPRVETLSDAERASAAEVRRRCTGMAVGLAVLTVVLFAFGILVAP